MSGLFEEPDADPLEPAPADAPLADRMRPRSLEELAGQQHLVGEGLKLGEAIFVGVHILCTFFVDTVNINDAECVLFPGPLSDILP